MGYQVVQDEMRRGRRTAQGINDQGYGFERMTDDFWDMTGRTARFYSEIWNLWVQLLSGGGGMPPWMCPPWRPQPQASARPPAKRPWRRMATCVEVEASRPVAVDLDLRMPAGIPVVPETQGLIAQPDMLGVQKPPLTDIRFHPAPVPDGIRVHVGIPDHQLPGIYSGAVFDRRTGRRLGTMTVRLHAGPVSPGPLAAEE